MRKQADLEDLCMDNSLHHCSESSQPLLYDSPSSPGAPWSPTLSFPRPKPFLATAPARRLLVLIASFSTIIVLAFASISLHFSPPQAVDSQTHFDASQPQLDPTEPDIAVQHDAAQTYSPYVLGPPTDNFRDNLRNDTRYITSWIAAGWTNDVMTYMNLIYLGIITSRVPIIAMFNPSHVTGASTIAFGDVFDVPRFIRESGVGILEWREVKDPESTTIEDLGCWNIWEVTQSQEAFPRRSWTPTLLGLDISYTRAPEWVKMVPDNVHSRSAAFWSLARLGFPEERARSLIEPLPSPQHEIQLPPDEHVLCYDYLYYVYAHQDDEFEHDFSPAWRFVGTHMHWSFDLQDLMFTYVRRAFGLAPNEDVPHYIAIHQRHGDFKNWCEDPSNPGDCFASVSVIARRVREVQEELRERKGIDVPDTRVIMTSDETDQTWWDEVTALGWARIDHDAWDTGHIYGNWYPVLLDAAIQSNAMGFVGTDRSTYSTISRRRVEDWQDGATRTIRWGYKGADDH